MNKNLTATVLIIISVGLYFTVTESMWNDAKTVKTKNDQLSSALSNAANIIKARNDVTLKYNSIDESDRERLNKMIPSNNDTIRLTIDLNNLALQNHFTLSNLKVSAPVNPGQNANAQVAKSVSTPISVTTSSTGVSSLISGQERISSVAEPILDKVQISFGVTASYEQFIDFLRVIELNLRIMDLTHLGVSATDTGVYTFDVQLQTYWLRQ